MKPAPDPGVVQCSPAVEEITCPDKGGKFLKAGVTFVCSLHAHCLEHDGGELQAQGLPWLPSAPLLLPLVGAPLSLREIKGNLS